MGIVAVTSKAVATLPLTAAVAQRACTGSCCHLATDCSSAAKGMHRFLGMLAVHHFCSSAGLYELQNLIGVVAVTSKAVATLPLISAVLQRACTGS